MKNKNLKIYFLLLLGTIASLYIYSLPSGIFGFFAAVFASIFIGITATKVHYVFAGLTSLVALVTAVLLDGIVAGLISGVTIVLVGLTLAIASNIKLSSYKTMTICTLLYLAESVIALKISDAALGNVSSYSLYLRQSGETLSQIMTQQYTLPADALASVDEIIDMMINLSYTLMPSMFIISALVSAALLLFAYKAVAAKFDINTMHFKKFSELRADRTISILFIFLILVLTASDSGMFFDAALNVVVILCLVFFVLGLCAIDYKLKIKKASVIHRRIVVIILLPLISLLFFIPFIAISGIAVADGIFGRKRIDGKEEQNGPQ